MLNSFFDKLFNRALTEEKFAKKFIESARRAGYSNALIYEESEFRLRQDNGSYFNLHNAFRDYQDGDKVQKASILNGYVATLLESGKQTGHAFEKVKAQLRPVIRNLAMLEEVRLEHVRSKQAPHEVVYQRLGHDCVTLLGLDFPESTATLTKGPEPQWGVTMDEALAIAINNLRDNTREGFGEIIPGLYIGQWADGYDSSRVLLPDVLQRAPIKGQPVFMIPNRDVLMVTGDKDNQGIRHMVELSFKALENGRAISTQIYTYKDRSIVPFQAGDDVTKQRRATLEHLLLQGNYQLQKELIDKINVETGKDVFVAKYNLFELADSDGQTVSLCTWTKGVVSMLPKTDRVALVEPLQDDEPNVKIVHWSELENECSELLISDNTYPLRFSTAGFPSAEQLSRLAPV